MSDKVRAILAVISVVLATIAQPVQATIVAEAEPNDSFVTAQNLDANFTIDADPEITNSTTMAHSSIRAASSDLASFDYYSFTVAADGTQGIFDIDHSGGFDSYLRLFDGGGNSLASNDDAALDPGSGTTLDSYLTYSFTNPGTYYIRVGACCELPTHSSYILNVSLGTSAVPEPATWAMMLLGFAAIGLAMSRQRFRISCPTAPDMR